ncbi:ATP-binding protein [Halobacillus faecis]|uniref:CRISPR-associated protein Cas2 n=1 Tax=Halobacillus faecis TaxID=360184 RepID=A0A511WN82_9BACI|nr:ATP-binding protein [Halobacillus faecis]GEN52600.1 CRISPR-associated protein Cas2 [Halobacillus faecis]
MARFVIMTVGMTHSGKTTFARRLEEKVKNTVVIDQDNQAAFLNSQYPRLVPEDGPNTIKYQMTKMLVDYAVEKTEMHLIICNSNRNHKARKALLEDFKSKGFSTILVNFDVSDSLLEKRVAERNRDPSVLRTASSFDEVLQRQQENSPNIVAPSAEEADHFFTIEREGEDNHVLVEVAGLLSS